MAASAPEVMIERSNPPEKRLGRPASTKAPLLFSASRNAARSASMTSWLRALALPSSRVTTVTAPEVDTVTASVVVTDVTLAGRSGVIRWRAAVRSLGR